MEHLQKMVLQPMIWKTVMPVCSWNTSPDTSPLKWWPKRLNLDILHQHDQENDYSKGDYREEVKSLDFEALEKDMMN